MFSDLYVTYGHQLLHQKGKPKLPSCDIAEELADSFNNFFTSKIYRIREALDSSDLDTYISSVNHCDSTILHRLTSYTVLPTLNSQIVRKQLLSIQKKKFSSYGDRAFSSCTQTLELSPRGQSFL